VKQLSLNIFLQKDIYCILQGYIEKNKETENQVITTNTQA